MKMSWAGHVVRMGENRNDTGFWLENWKQTDSLEHSAERRQILSKLMLNKMRGRGLVSCDSG
jgi:hypothetical protein